jgi:small conductance mechanosensitive channel
MTGPLAAVIGPLATPVAGLFAPLQAGTGFQQYFTTTTAKIAASAAAVLLLVLVALFVQAAGPRLKQRVPDDDVEAVQAVVFSIAAGLTGWFLVVVWRAADEVVGRFGVIQLGPRQGALALVAFLTLVIAYTLTRVSKGLLEGANNDVITAHRREAIHHLLQIAIYVVAGLFVLALAGVDPGDLIVGAGALGLVVGLAARQTVGAVLAGFVILLARPFAVGDWVVVDGEEGVVTDLTLFNTELRTWDDEHVVIPNDQVSSSNIVNRSRSGRLRLSVDVGVDYGADVTRAAEIAEQAMVDCETESLLDDPAPTVVGKSFDDSAVLLECRFWIGDPSAPAKWETQTAVIRAIKHAFEAEGVKIPFPQRELTGRAETDGLRLAGGPVAVGDEERGDRTDRPRADGEGSDESDDREGAN